MVEEALRCSCAGDSQVTTMATPPSFRDGDGDDMKASLWGELQSFIDLSLIYAKLPLAPFFRLRLVCKEWNRLASDRQFLEENFKPLITPNPYFVVTHRRLGDALLTSKGSSWSPMRLPPSRCEVSGLLFDDSDRKRNRVFDLHTGVFYTLPPLPVVMQAWRRPVVDDYDHYGEPLIGMTVDTTLIPYGFRVIIADQEVHTWIYDSYSCAWTHKPSKYDYKSPVTNTDSCVHHNKLLYMRVGDLSAPGYHFHIYDLERDEWECQVPGVPQHVWEFGDIGLWRDRWFVVGVNVEPNVVTVWDMNTEFEEPWTLFDSMPGDLSEWLFGGSPLAHSRFFGEHVLVYKCWGYEERAVLYNLDRKTWDKIELPKPPPNQLAIPNSPSD